MRDFPIVVGFDGSASAREALRWALDEAAGRKVPLRLVYVDEHPTETHRKQAESLLADAVAEAATTHPAVEVSSTVRSGSAPATLCELSREARLLVVGARGRSGVASLLVGSTSMAVVAHARAPVVVVRDSAADGKPGGPVVVGLDDSPHAQVAAAFAFEEAAVRKADLVAVRAWKPPRMPWRSDVRPLVRDVAEIETAERRSLQLALDGLAAKNRSVPVTTRLIAGDARHVLAEASTGAQLVVVGSRGRGGFPGSISHYLLHHAHCPVAVVPR